MKVAVNVVELLAVTVAGNVIPPIVKLEAFVPLSAIEEIVRLVFPVLVMV